MPVGPVHYTVTSEQLNDGWITREDAALKARLQGIRVPVAVDDRPQDIDAGRDADRDDAPPIVPSKTRAVPVYFRLPENEVRARTYPFITIDFIAAVRDVEREHRGFTTLGAPDDPDAYEPPGTPDEGGRTELPVPFRLDYQITQWARYNRHDRIIMTSLLTTRLAPRFGYLEMVPTLDAPDDHSVRRMDLLSGPTPADMRDAEGKRLFRKMYTVGIQSELFPSDMAALARADRTVLAVEEWDHH